MSPLIPGPFGMGPNPLGGGLSLKNPIPSLAIPVPDFSADALNPAINDLVSFTDLSTGSPTKWDWDFGDGTTSTADPNPTHRYQATGAKTVTMTATNASGSKSTTKVGYIVVK
jgi:PKD repeat protein